MADVTVRTGAGDERVALVELVNRVVDRGVVLSGELTISVAKIDLLYVGLRLLLCSADRVQREPEERTLLGSDWLPSVGARYEGGAS